MHFSMGECIHRLEGQRGYMKISPTESVDDVLLDSQQGDTYDRQECPDIINSRENHSFGISLHPRMRFWKVRRHESD